MYKKVIYQLYWRISPQESTEHIYISAKRRENTNELQKMLINAAHLPTVTQNDVIVTNVRHYEALNKALDAIHRVQNGLLTHIFQGDFPFHKTYVNVSFSFPILQEK